jgi:hypothetical protein
LHASHGWSEVYCLELGEIHSQKPKQRLMLQEIINTGWSSAARSLWRIVRLTQSLASRQFSARPSTLQDPNCVSRLFKIEPTARPKNHPIPLLISFLTTGCSFAAGMADKPPYRRVCAPCSKMAEDSSSAVTAMIWHECQRDAPHLSGAELKTFQLRRGTSSC